jgi:Phosphoribosyltransferase
VCGAARAGILPGQGHAPGRRRDGHVHEPPVPQTPRRLLAVRAEPAVQSALVACQLSRERAHHAVLASLGVEPLLQLRLRSGEGVGACLAAQVLLTALRARRATARVTNPYSWGSKDLPGSIRLSPARAARPEPRARALDSSPSADPKDQSQIKCQPPQVSLDRARRPRTSVPAPPARSQLARRPAGIH